MINRGNLKLPIPIKLPTTPGDHVKQVVTASLFTVSTTHPSSTTNTTCHNDAIEASPKIFMSKMIGDLTTGIGTDPYEQDFYWSNRENDYNVHRNLISTERIIITDRFCLRKQTIMGTIIYCWRHKTDTHKNTKFWSRTYYLPETVLVH